MPAGRREQRIQLWTSPLPSGAEDAPRLSLAAVGASSGGAQGLAKDMDQEPAWKYSMLGSWLCLGQEVTGTLSTSVCSKNKWKNPHQPQSWDGCDTAVTWLHPIPVLLG